MKCLATNMEANWSVVAAEGSVLTLTTNAGAPRNRIVAIDAEAAAEGALSAGAFSEVLPQHSRDLLQACSALLRCLAAVASGAHARCGGWMWRACGASAACLSCA